jgi:hypothetical protein
MRRVTLSGDELPGADILKAMAIMDEIEAHLLPLAGRNVGG